MSNGFMFISREKIDDFEWSNNPNVFYVFFKLLFKASYKDKKWEGVDIKRGQLVTGRVALSKELNVSEQVIRTCLDKLTKTGYINQQSTNRYTIITICNYDSWQKTEKTNNQQPTSEPTNNQPTDNHNINKYNKESKDIKEEESNDSKKKEELLSRLSELERTISSLEEENKKLREEKEKSEKKKTKAFSPPTEAEVSAYILEKGYHFNAASFVSFYESKGWMVGKNKMKDWKAACRNWEGSRSNSSNSGGDGSPKEELTIVERFTSYVNQFYPFLRDMELPNEAQLKEMLAMCDNHIEGCLDMLQTSEHFTGSLYDLFKKRFGGDR